VIARVPTVRVPVPVNEVLAVFVPLTVNVYDPACVDAEVAIVRVDVGDPSLTDAGENDVDTPVGTVLVQPTKLKVTGSLESVPLPL